MRLQRLHDWHLSTSQALDLQRRLAGQVSRSNGPFTPRFIAGTDVATGNGVGTAALVVLSYPELKVVETSVVQGKLDFLYVPGLLSFRESPLILAAAERLNVTPDLIMVDGQGMAHPRRFGLACHLGLFLDTPVIGCAKSRLCGQHETPGDEAGSYTELIDGGETIGAALRTKTGVKPLYISIGHKLGLEAAIHWVLECCRGYRLPEPTRLAHLAAGGNLKTAETATTAAAVS